MISDAISINDAIKIIENDRALFQNTKVYIRLVDLNGEIVAETSGMDGEIPRNDIRKDELFLFQGPSGKTYMIKSETFLGNSSHPKIIQVATEVPTRFDVLAPYKGGMWLALIAAFILSGATGYRIARRSMKPVQNFEIEAQSILTALIERRVNTAILPLELAPLGEAFNETLERLKVSFEHISRFSDDIAHELRTPLSIIRGQIEVALSSQRSDEQYRDVLASSLEEVVSLSDLVHRLLFLSRLENHMVPKSFTQCDLLAEMKLSVDFYEVLAIEGNISLSLTSKEERIFALVDRVLFQRVLGNLVTNSIRHTPSGGKIELCAVLDGGHVLITVKDTGCGIEAHHLENLFDRFYRIDQSRNSSGDHIGLGLTIVKGIIDLHDGTIDVTSTINEGTTVVITLPVTTA